jgi:hypothetical protein
LFLSFNQKKSVTNEEKIQSGSERKILFFFFHNIYLPILPVLGLIVREVMFALALSEIGHAPSSIQSQTGSGSTL